MRINRNHCLSFLSSCLRNLTLKQTFEMNKILILFISIGLQGCTVLAVADAEGSAVVSAGKAVINTVDAT